MRECFRLPMSQDEAARVLLGGVRAEVELRGKKFVVNDTLQAQAREIAKWLTADGPKFGLLLCGGCGNGKTTFVKAFQQIINALNMRVGDSIERYGMRIVNARELVRICRKDYEQWRELSNCRMLAIDDFGTEPVELSDYGNVVYPITDLLTTRYDRSLFTIITTNLRPQEIRPKYGDRIADRLNEMMGKVIFNNATYRTQ